MKSKNPKIQTILTKGIVVLMSAMLTATPIVQATSSLDDSYLDTSWVDKLLYGSVGSTAKEIEEYLIGHDTLYITDETQLRALAEFVNNGNNCSGKRIVLLNNIEIDSSTEWVPIGNGENHFKGNFEGNGFTVSGLKFTKYGKSYEELSYVGLFGYVSNGSVKNVNIEDFDINILWEEKEIIITDNSNEDKLDFKYRHNGNLIGYAQNSRIENCTNNSNIYAGCSVGGLVGTTSFSTIKNCKNSGYVEGVGNVGGIVGKSEEATSIQGCSNSGNVFVFWVTGGGLVGHLDNSDIEDCKNAGMILSNREKISINYSGKVSDHSFNLGGIVGRIDKNSGIRDTINTGAVTGYNQVGGIAGLSNTAALINNCKNTGVITGNNSVGGIVGAGSESYILNASNVEKVTGKFYIGGIIGTAAKTCIATSTNVLGSAKDNDRYILGENEVGGIAGRAYSESEIQLCINRSAVRGIDRVGGIAGHIFSGSTIRESINADAILDELNGSLNTRDIYGNVLVGGIVGYTNESTIEYCTNVAEICAVKSIAGGIAGEAKNSDIKNCIAHQGIYHEYKYWKKEGNTWVYRNTENIVNTTLEETYTMPRVAGLIVGKIHGYNPSSNITGCFVGGKIYGGMYLGGVAGEVSDGTINCTNISRCEKLENIKSYVYDEELERIKGETYDPITQLYGTVEDYPPGSRDDRYSSKVTFQTQTYKGVELVVNDNTQVYHVKGTLISTSNPNTSITIRECGYNVGADVSNNIGYVESVVGMKGTDANGIEAAFTFSGGTVKNGIRYYKKGQTITVNASFSKYLVTAAVPLTPISRAAAPILKLNDSMAMTASNVAASNYKTTVTYTYTVDSDTSFDITKVKLDKPSTKVYAVGEDYATVHPELGNITADIYGVKVDTQAPGINTNVYVENALQTGTYTAGKDVIIEITSNETIQGDHDRPEIQVNFSKSGTGKYNYSEDDNKVGYAKCIDATYKNDVTTWKYIYQIQEGDEGILEVNYMSGSLKDLAGNSTNVNTISKVVANDIIADTTIPTVEITSNKGNTTNADSIRYTFKWSEQVLGFTTEDITVNNGAKGTLSNGTRNSDGTYTYTLDVTPTVAAGNEGYVQVIVEQNACQDLVALGNVRTENITKVDKISPIFIGLESYAESTITLDSNVDTVKQYYKVGDIVRIIATFTENIESSDIPTLNLEFSESGNAKGEVTFVEVRGNKLYYRYNITNGDMGTLSVKGFSGRVVDVAGNATRVTKRALDGDTIIADTKAPKLNELKVVSPASDVYKAGTTIKIEAIYDEEIYAFENNQVQLITTQNAQEKAPILKLKFGDSTERTATAIGYGITDGKEDRTKIEYRYTIIDANHNDNEEDNGDNGILELTSYSDKTLCDIAGNIANLDAEQTGNEIEADTIRPIVTDIAAIVEELLIQGINGDPSDRQTGYYKVGHEVKITLTFSEPVSGNKIAPKILIGFSEDPEVEPTTYSAYAYEADWNVMRTIMEYSYTIKEGDNGYLWIKVEENQFADEAENGNILKEGTRLENIFADTTAPTVTLTRDTEVEQNNQTIIIKATFSENVYDLNGNRRITLTRANAPKLIYSFGVGANKEVGASDVNGAVITYTINKDSVDDNGTLFYELAKGNLCDRAGNLYYVETTDTTAPVLESVVISSNTGKYHPYCKAGSEIYVTATFDEPIVTENIKIKAKVGESGEPFEIDGEIVVENPRQVRFTYEVRPGDTGRFQVLDVCGNTDNEITEEGADKTYGWVKDARGNQNNIYSFTGEGISISGTAEADTTSPYITSIRAISNGKEIATYTKETADAEAVITVGRTNGNIVEYIVTYSERVPYDHFDRIVITNGEIRDVEYTNSSKNEYKITVQTTVEGVQSLIINEGTVEDKAGNIDGFVRMDAVTTDFTKPTVRFISEYNGGIYVLPTNIDKVEIRPNVEINEEIEKIEYKWDNWENGDYVEIENYSSSSDIAIPTETFTEFGQYKLFIKVEDLAGNVYITSKTYFVQNSYIGIDYNNNYTNQPLTITVSFGEGLTDNRKVMFRAEGTNESIELVAEGTNEIGTEYIIDTNGTIYAEATDRVGNKVFTEDTIRNIDMVDPEIAIELNGANLVIGTGEDKAIIKTNVETRDNEYIKEAKYVFSVEDIDVSNYKEKSEEQKAAIRAKITNVLTSGVQEVQTEASSTKDKPSYYLYVIASDEAGNETIIKSNPFTVLDTNERKTTETVEGEDGPIEQEVIIPPEKPIGTLIIFEQVEEDIKDKAYVNIRYDDLIIKESNVILEDESYGFIDENYVELYGNTTIKVEAWDACGNRVYNEYSVTDIEGPEITIFNNPEEWTSDDVILEIHSGAELKSLTMNGDNIPLNKDKCSAIKEITQYGNYTFRATDIYNNTSEQTIEVKIDKSAPEITDVKVENGEIIITANDFDKTLRRELSGVVGYAITKTNEIPVEWSESNVIKTTVDGVFYVWIKDAVGHVTMREEIVIRDITPPELTITANPELGNWVNTDINITVKANEELSSLVVGYKEIVEDENGEPKEEDRTADILATKTYTITTKGTYTITAKDISGNETVETIEAKIDKDLPEITQVVFAEKAITITAEDATSGIAGYAITATTEVPVEWSESNIIKMVEEGTFYVWVKDNAGNIVRKEEVVIVDTVAPELTITANPELGEWVNTDINIIVEANEELSSLVVGYKELVENEDGEMIEEDRTVDILATKTYTITTKGTYTITAKDISGNETVETIEAKIDKDLPEITEVVFAAKAITITAEDATSGIAGYAITATTEVPVEWSESNIIKMVEEGIFYVWVKDNAGNIVRKEEVVIVDTVAPELTITADPETKKWVNTDINITVEANEELSSLVVGYKELVENEDGEITEEDRTVDILATKTYTITTKGTYTIVAKDITGNETVKTIEAKIDKDLPKITDAVPEGKSITITAEDATSGIAGYAITKTTEVPVVWDDTNVIKTTKDGTFYVWVKDNAGNIVRKEEAVIIDTTAPEITFSYLSQTVTVGMPLEANIVTNENAIISYSWDKENWVDSEELISSLTVSEKSTTPGKYTLYAKAKDSVGNESEIQVLEFTVTTIEEIKQPNVIFEDMPTIQINGARYIKIPKDMIQAGLINKMNKEALCGKTPEFINLTEDGRLRTGSKITLNGETKYIIAIEGDINCDGNVTFEDIIKANAVRISEKEQFITIEQLLASDINSTGKIEFRDIISINAIRINSIK